MCTWQVSLTGDEQDLQLVESLSQLPAWRVFRPHPHGGYILEASAFSKLGNAGLVREHATHHLVPLINGIAFMEFDRRMSGRIGVGAGITRDHPNGSRTGYLVIQTTAFISAEESITISTNGGPHFESPVGPTFAEMATALVDDPEVQEALHFFAYEDEWATNLFRVFEIVRASVGGYNRDLVRLGWVSWHEVEDRIKSLHDPRESARAARHGVPKGPPPQDPFDEEEARAFIKRILHAWIESKYASIPPTLTT